jgi:hypothetical protein
MKREVVWSAKQGLWNKLYPISYFSAGNKTGSRAFITTNASWLEILQSLAFFIDLHFLFYCCSTTPTCTNVFENLFRIIGRSGNWRHKIVGQSTLFRH